jgi:hypothetical protein
LTAVSLVISEPSAAGRIESLMAGLQCCSQIELLALFSKELTVAHLNQLLPRLPRLRSLNLGRCRITTLSFLSQQPTAGQLSCLSLFMCTRLPLAELRHVHALRALDTLRLFKSFDESMDALSQSLYTPPSALMPQLEEFFYKP